MTETTLAVVKVPPLYGYDAMGRGLDVGTLVDENGQYLTLVCNRDQLRTLRADAEHCTYEGMFMPRPGPDIGSSAARALTRICTVQFELARPKAAAAHDTSARFLLAITRVDAHENT